VIVIVVLQNGGVVGVSTGVLVNVGVGVGVNVAVGVLVGVSVNIEVAVGVEVAVAVEVAEAITEAEVVAVADAVTDVDVEAGLGFDVAVGEKYTDFFVGLAKTRAAFVAIAVVVAGTAVWVAIGVPTVAVLMDVPTVVDIAVIPENEAPGVRKLSLHTGLVRMAGSTGSMNPFGLRVRKSLFGSSLDSTLTSNCHCGLKRSAHLPASRSASRPNKRMKAITVQSRLSFSVAFMRKSIKRQSHMNRSARTQLLVMAGAFDPNPSMVRVDNAARNSQT